MQSKRMLLALGLTLCGLCAAWAAAKQTPTPPVTLKNDQGESVQLYDDSYALLIGVSDYQYWPDLSGVNDDIPAVTSILEQHGFTVVPALNKNFADMKDAIDVFITTYGMKPNTRLLFYFSGHGATLRMSYGGEMGYFVPADAPSLKGKSQNEPAPADANPEFVNKALDMQL